MIKRYAHAQSQLVSMLVMSLILIGFYISFQFPGFVEQHYSTGVYIAISRFLRFFINPIPFSLGDILYMVFVIWALYRMISFIIRLFKSKFKPGTRYVLKGIINIQLLLVLFYTLWGGNYFRQPAWKVLNLKDTSYTLDEVKQVSRLLIDSLNSTRSRLRTQDLQVKSSTLYPRSVAAVQNLNTLDMHIVVWHPQVKTSLFTSLLNYMGTSGYTNPFTGEAQVNNQMPVFERPVTACHEMAHQLGFAREDEANFVGFIAASHSRDQLLKYSAYYLAVEEFLLYMRRRDSVAHQQLRQLLSPAVKSDLRTDSIYWTKYEGRIQWLTGKFYNQFLKANNQPAGLHTYNRMIVLTIAYYKQRRPLPESLIFQKHYP